MDESYFVEVDKVLALFNEECQKVNRELAALEEIRAGQRKAGRFPLGKKFLINRGRFADRLMKVLEAKLGRLDD